MVVMVLLRSLGGRGGGLLRVVDAVVVVVAVDFEEGLDGEGPVEMVVVMLGIHSCKHILKLLTKGHCRRMHSCKRMLKPLTKGDCRRKHSRKRMLKLLTIRHLLLRCQSMPLPLADGVLLKEVLVCEAGVGSTDIEDRGDKVDESGRGTVAKSYCVKLPNTTTIRRYTCFSRSLDPGRRAM